MFLHIKAAHPDAETVRGSSWLYNIEAYRRLFPPDFVATARPVEAEPGFWATWGQFICKRDQLNETTANQFLHHLSQQTTVEGCLDCFPYAKLELLCPITVFYTFYGV